MKATGWVIALAALGMMLGLLSGDISALKSWSDVTYPAFMAGIFAHLSVVIAAFVGGNLIPNMFDKKENKVSEQVLSSIR